MFYGIVKPILDAMNGKPPSPGTIGVWVIFGVAVLYVLLRN